MAFVPLAWVVSRGERKMRGSGVNRWRGSVVDFGIAMKVEVDKERNELNDEPKRFIYNIGEGGRSFHHYLTS
jgi:hypothetical protein